VFAYEAWYGGIQGSDISFVGERSVADIQHNFRHRVMGTLLTEGSADPIISTSATWSSWLCALGFGEGLHDPTKRTAVPVERLSEAELALLFQLFGIQLGPLCLTRSQKSL
jgi:hypothetical protein